MTYEKIYRQNSLIDVTYVGHRCCDHSPSSGYDQVCSLFPEAGWLDGRSLEAGRFDWCREPKRVSSNVKIFHVIYGDCSGKVLPEILRRIYPDAIIVVTVHQPVSRLIKDRAAQKALLASHAIIAVSEVQGRDFRKLGLNLPIYTVPHGVWTSVFRPRSLAPSYPRKNVLLIGSYLRDWHGARQVAETLSHHGVGMVAVGKAALESLRAKDASVKFLPRVSENRLAELYDNSAVLFLPVVDATASNALLESMAAGCPIVCPRLPSLVEEYLNDESDAFEIGEYAVAASRILHYVMNPFAREIRQQELIARSNEFDWSRMKSRYSAIYEEVAANVGTYERPIAERQKNAFGMMGQFT